MKQIHPWKSPVPVSLLAIPDAMLSSLTGVYDALNCFEMLGSFRGGLPRSNPFRAEIVGPNRDPVPTASGLPLGVHGSIHEVSQAGVVIVPSVMVEGGAWKTGRYPKVLDWLSAMHDRGALICSACSGVLLLAETGLLNGRDATVHWAYARTFRENFPKVNLQVEKVLVTSGDRQEFIMSGASASWHDLVLHLVARLAGPAAAQGIAKFMLLQWHRDGQTPYQIFQPVTDHGDGPVLASQEWLDEHFAESNPVEQMAQQSGLPERSFKRRFTEATGLPPLSYVQHLRIEEAKYRLERTDTPADEVAWSVGYDNPAFFRRLFKRIAGITPGAYRRKFRLPEYAGTRRGAAEIRTPG